MTAVLPGDIAGLDLHWKADAITPVADGTAISSWAASVGTPPLAQATGSLQPLYRVSTAALNNMPSLDFDGTDDALTATIANDNQATTWFMVVDDDLAAGNAQLMQCSQQLGYLGSTQMQAWAGATNMVVTTPTRYVGRRIVIVVYNAASSVIYDGDGTTKTPTTNASGVSLGTNGSGTTLWIADHSTGAWPNFNGRIAEVGRYTVGITATDAANLYEGLAEKYGTIARRQRPTVATLQAASRSASF